jgi:hypothetical protein
MTASVPFGAVALLARQADLLSDSAGWDIERVNDRDEPLGSQVVAGGTRGLSGVAATLHAGPDVVADYEFFNAIDRLGGEAAVADELPARLHI